MRTIIALAVLVYAPRSSTCRNALVGHRHVIVTIDGPAGAGKSTAAKALAARLGYTYLDSGALYRAVAWKMQAQYVDLSSEAQVRQCLAATTIQVDTTRQRLAVYVDGNDVTPHLRTPEVGRLASIVAMMPSVREWLLPLQRGYSQRGGIVAEGRDMGTRVFPAADVKFYLDADLETRARRRLGDDAQRGSSRTVDAVRAELAERDARDTLRDIAPLRPASDAIVIDTSTRSLEQVVETMVEAMATRL